MNERAGVRERDGWGRGGGERGGDGGVGGGGEGNKKKKRSREMWHGLRSVSPWWESLTSNIPCDLDIPHLALHLARHFIVITLVSNTQKLQCR